MVKKHKGPLLYALLVAAVLLVHAVAVAWDSRADAGTDSQRRAIARQA